MPGVSYALANFVTGDPIIDLPVKEGATWGVGLNRADTLSCTVDMRDADNLALDLPSSSEPRKTILFARNDADVIIAWGLVEPREWDEDAHDLEITATGVWDSYFGETIIAPPDARTVDLTVVDGDGYVIVNPVLNSTYTDLSLGTIGKKIVEQELAWPGAPTIFDLPVDLGGTHDRDYPFADFKRIGAALTDLTEVENGPDFAFDAYRTNDGLAIRATMRVGTNLVPRLGTHVGSWNIGLDSPITGLKMKDDPSNLGSIAFLSAGKTSGVALLARRRNDALVTSAGYPPFHIIDTSHSDVSKQSTLDTYAAEAIRFGGRVYREISFSVRGDATPGLGQYRPGDTITLDFPEDHPWQKRPIDVRLTSMSGDETGKTVKIGCVIVDG